MPYGRPDILHFFSGVIEDTAKQQIKDFSDENLLMELACKNAPDVSSRALLAGFTQTPNNADKTENDIKRIFQLWRLSNMRERNDVFRRANENAERLAHLIQKPDTPTLKTVRRECDSHGALTRMTLIAYMSRYAGDYDKKTYGAYIKLNKGFMKGCINSLLKYLEDVSEEDNASEEKKDFTAKEYEDEIRRLNASLRHANGLIALLQEELSDTQKKGAEQFMITLNSSKYGNIIDLLEGAQTGFKQLQKKGPIPFEIKDAKTLLRRLKDFMADCGVMPMLEPGMRILVKAADIDAYNYEGAPFLGPDDVKEVEIVSPGWTIPERELILSQPKVKEITEEK